MKSAKKQQKKTQPLNKKEDVQKNPDHRIDQDFPGYPHPLAQEKIINPKTDEEKATANLKKKNNNSEQDSDGSANAFEGTENNEILREELNKNESKKNKSNY